MENKHLKAIFFDFDGTIVDSSQSIYASIQYALNQLNLPSLTEDTLATFVGPPLLDSFIRIGLSDKDAENAVVKYREYYQEHLHLVKLYPEIKKVLSQLKKNYQLFIASSKPEIFVRKIAEIIEVDQYFTAIYGANLAGTVSTKAEVIAYALQQRSDLSADHVIMVGDRSHDCFGAIQNNMDCIGVTYGFGSKDELIHAGAKSIVDKPIQLLDVF